MPRGTKQKVIVIRCPKTNKILKHKYFYNCKGGGGKTIEKADVVGASYNPVTRKHHKGEEFKVKDERHSS